jgi:arylsulfatase A-like enzyme
MLGVGFKLPHLALHVPHRFYKMYAGASADHSQPYRYRDWRLSKRELKFPRSASALNYRCCNYKTFNFMRAEGALRSNTSESLGNINKPFRASIHRELMIGYMAAVSYVDAQLGRVLDEMDRRGLWANTTVVLTADHGQVSVCVCGFFLGAWAGGCVRE